MKPYYINENIAIKVIRDEHRCMSQRGELTTRSMLEEHSIVMNIVTGK